MKELPIEFSERMKALLGNEFDDYISALSFPPVRGFRVNTDKLSLDKFNEINIWI